MQGTLTRAVEPLQGQYLQIHHMHQLSGISPQGYFSFGVIVSLHERDLFAFYLLAVL